VPSDPSVYIVDDDPALRDSLLVLLDSKGYRVQSFASAREFLTVAPSLPLGCLIVDIRMPEMDGLELGERLRAQALEFPMIVITGHADVPLAVQAMKGGAVDFIEKPFAAEQLLEGIEAARSRLAALPSELDPATAAAASRLALLSPREREVLEGLLDGLPNKSIAYDLAISPRTVEIHRARVMDKMGARSLSELIRLALAAGVRPRRGPRGVSLI
jgi:two-component system, LuxR family, response regulator FixJ